MTWHFAEMHHLEVGSCPGALALSCVHLSPLLLDLNEQRHLATHTRVRVEIQLVALAAAKYGIIKYTDQIEHNDQHPNRIGPFFVSFLSTSKI